MMTLVLIKIHTWIEFLPENNLFSHRSHVSALNPVWTLVKSSIFLLDFCLAKTIVTTEEKKKGNLNYYLVKT